jgi:hypothetical protein
VGDALHRVGHYCIAYAPTRTAGELARAVQHPFALRREPGKLLPALDDGDAELRFDVTNRRRQGGRVHMAGLGGAAEVLLAGERDEVEVFAGDHGR